MPMRTRTGRSVRGAGLLAADTWPTKAVLTRFMSAPVAPHIVLPVGHDCDAACAPARLFIFAFVTLLGTGALLTQSFQRNFL